MHRGYWWTDERAGVGRIIRRARSEAVGIPLEELRKRNIESIPLGRMIPPEDVAKVAAFIAGPGARNITGQTFNVDGGTLKN